MSFEGRLSVSNPYPFLIEAEELLSDHTSHLIIDTRSEEHYAAGHIHGAIHFCTYDRFVRSTSPIGLSRFQKSMAESYSKIGVDPHKPVVVYEEETGMPFTPDNFWRDRSQYLFNADIVFCVRTGLSESTAAEIFYTLGKQEAQTGRFDKDKFHILACKGRGEVRTTMLKQFNIVEYDPEDLSAITAHIKQALEKRVLVPC